MLETISRTFGVAVVLVALGAAPAVAGERYVARRLVLVGDRDADVL